MQNLKLNFNKWRQNYKITPSRVAILGLILALMITLKYALGFIPGVEMISFMFIMLGIFLPTLDLLLLISSFNALIIVIYGFGSWWFMYWIIWPVDALVSKAISLKIKNKFIFGVWGFIAGASVGFWYFWSDWFFFGLTFARLNIITAIPINTIEGITTMISIIIIGPQIAKVFSTRSKSIWNQDKPFVFDEVKNMKLNILTTIMMCLLSFSGIITLFVKNQYFFDWKNRESKQYFKPKRVFSISQTILTYDPQDITSLDGFRTLLSKEGGQYGGNGHHVIAGSDFNYIQHLMKTIPGPQAAIVVIANNKFYTDIIDLNKKIIKAQDLMDNSKRFIIRHFNPGVGMGDWMASWKFKGDKTWRHGTSDSQNYGDYYPLYYVNHKFANLGISNLQIDENYILEITYDHNA